jgi:hypothetical protein
MPPTYDINRLIPGKAQADQYSAQKPGLDQTLAELLILLTQHGVSDDEGVLASILERLDSLCVESELEFFPQQQSVIHKIRTLWQLKLLQAMATTTAH